MLLVTQSKTIDKGSKFNVEISVVFQKNWNTQQKQSDVNKIVNIS